MLLNIEGKTEDTTNTRLDLENLKMLKDQRLQMAGDRIVRSHATYTH